MNHTFKKNTINYIIIIKKIMFKRNLVYNMNFELLKVGFQSSNKCVKALKGKHSFILSKESLSKTVYRISDIEYNTKILPLVKMSHFSIELPLTNSKITTHATSIKIINK